MPVQDDIGDAWLGYHAARIQQRHVQFERHFRLDMDSLLARARLSRSSHFGTTPGIGNAPGVDPRCVPGPPPAVDPLFILTVKTAFGLSR